MAHVGTLRDFRFADNADDVRGAALYGRDNDKLGKIDDVIFDHETGALRYAVVDTGGWLSSKKFLVPADRIRARGEKDDEYAADLTKKQIEAFPAFDEKHMEDEKRWSDYEKNYRKASGFEESGGVLHEAGGTNVLIPDSIPATGPAPTGPGGEPISGYKSPIRHHNAGMMNTTPTGWGDDPDNERMTHVNDALATDRGDIEDRQIEEAKAARSTPTGRLRTPETLNPVREIGEAADIARATRDRDIANREKDRTYHTDRGSKLSPEEQTMEGDSVFNSADIQDRMGAEGSPRSADEPNYAVIAGGETETSQGRTPNYPDASQGQRWARFEENLRRQRPNVIGRCSICESFQNQHREDVA